MGIVNIGAAANDGTGDTLRNAFGKINDRFARVFDVKDYGAAEDGVTDDTTAIQAAITACRIAGGGTVQGSWAKKYLTNTGIVVPYLSGNAGDGRVRLSALRLLAGADNICVVRYADSYGSFDVEVDGNGFTGVSALRLAPEDESQTTAVVNQNYNKGFKLVARNCAEGLVMMCGPDVSTVDSGCWYNDGLVLAIGCLRALWMKNPTNTGGSLVTKSKITFQALNFGGTVNTGIQIDAGANNDFYNASCEGINGGSSPNTTPTALKISGSSLGGSDNNSNRFFGFNFEANTRDVDLSNALTEFYGWNPDPSKCVFTATPLVAIGNGPSQTPTVLPGYIFQSDSQISGVPNNFSYFTNGIVCDGGGMQVLPTNHEAGPGGDSHNFDFSIPYVPYAQYQIRTGFNEDTTTPTVAKRVGYEVCETVSGTFVTDVAGFTVTVGSPTTATFTLSRVDAGTLRIAQDILTGGSIACRQYASITRLA